jgi:hypothetical protein
VFACTAHLLNSERTEINVIVLPVLPVCLDVPSHVLLNKDPFTA